MNCLFLRTDKIFSDIFADRCKTAIKLCRLFLRPISKFIWRNFKFLRVRLRIYLDSIGQKLASERSSAYPSTGFVHLTDAIWCRAFFMTRFRRQKRTEPWSDLRGQVLEWSTETIGNWIKTKDSSFSTDRVIKSMTGNFRKKNWLRVRYLGWVSIIRPSEHWVQALYQMSYPAWSNKLAKQNDEYHLRTVTKNYCPPFPLLNKNRYELSQHPIENLNPIKLIKDFSICLSWLLDRRPSISLNALYWSFFGW